MKNELLKIGKAVEKLGALYETPTGQKIAKFLYNGKWKVTIRQYCCKNGTPGKMIITFMEA